MKMNFQIMNTPNPNSVVNTYVFSVYEGPDSKTNLHVALARYKAQVDELKQMRWTYVHLHICKPHMTVAIHCPYRNSSGDQFTTEVFLSGDYEFLCHMYGLSGASGTHML